MARSGFHGHEYSVSWNEMLPEDGQRWVSSVDMRPAAADQGVAVLGQASPHNSSYALPTWEQNPVEGIPLEPRRLNNQPDWAFGGPAAEASDGQGRKKNHKKDEELLEGSFGTCLFLQSFFLELLSIISFYRTLIGTAVCFSLPLLLFLGWSAGDVRARCLYVIGVMILFWLSNCMDAYAVAFLPFVLFPGLNVVSVGDVAMSYMNSVSFLIFGASMMAAALRRVKLDHATANWLSRISPKHPEDLALCMMTTCFMVSTCLSNTGTMLIFCPIIDLMIRDLHPEHVQDYNVTGPLERPEAEAVPAAMGPINEPPCLPRVEEQVVSLQGHDMNSGTDDLPNTLVLQKKDDPGKVAGCCTPLEPKKTVSRTSASLDTEAKTDRMGDSESADARSDEISHESPDVRKIRNMLFIGCAYAATLGGSATATGSTSNAIFLAVLDAMYANLPGGSAANPVNYTTWLIVSFPLALIQLFLVWISLGAVWMGPKAAGASLVRLAYRPVKSLLARCRRPLCGHGSSSKHADPTSVVSTAARTGVGVSVMPEGSVTEKQHADIPKHDELYMARIYVVLAWLLLVCLWLSRRTIVKAVPGWGSRWNGYIDDSWPAMLVPLCLWFVPLYPRRSQSSVEKAISYPARWWKRRKRLPVAPETALPHQGALQTPLPDGVQGSRRFESILTFSVVEKEMDWGLLFLLGSGFVVASVSHACGLDKVMVDNMAFLKTLSRSGQVAITMAMAALVSQVTSNTATASILMPLLSTAAKALPGNPLLLMLAANFATTLGFLLPVSTASNAVIVRFTRIGIWQFFLSGLLPLALCLGAAYAATFTWVAAVFHLCGEYPRGGH